jgi:hypothetical protein
MTKNLPYGFELFQMAMKIPSKLHKILPIWDFVWKYTFSQPCDILNKHCTTEALGIAFYTHIWILL